MRFSPASLFALSLLLSPVIKAEPPAEKTKTTDAPKPSFDPVERRVRFLKMMEDQKRRQADNRFGLPKYVEEMFGPIIAGLTLSPAQKAELLRLLIKRELAIADRRDDFHNRENAAEIADPLSFNPEPKGFSEREKDAELAQAAADPENEIKVLVGPAVFATVQEMLEHRFEISRISYGYGKSFEEDGHPLSVEQYLHLASVLHWLNSSENYPRRNKNIPLNSSGLTPVLEEALEKMRGHLSPEQAQGMRADFIFTERNVRGIPLEWEQGCDLPSDAAEVIANACGQGKGAYGKIYITLRGSGKVKLNPRWNNDPREYCAVMYELSPTDKNGHPYLMSGYGVALFYDGQFVRTTGENQVIWNGHKPRAKL